MPEVDAFIGLDQITKVAPIIENLVGKQPAPATKEENSATDDPRDYVTLKPKYVPDYTTPRFRLTPEHFAYVKIAEGCNHTCTFCIIPKIRGVHRSRTQESVVREVEALVKAGVKEINLISQDTTYFGMVTADQPALVSAQINNVTFAGDKSRGFIRFHIIIP